MSEYYVKDVVCDYGVYEDGVLKLILNSRGYAQMICDILKLDEDCYKALQHDTPLPPIMKLYPEITDETILSLRAVLHGCNTNNKCKVGYFAYDIKNPHNFPIISFEQAINNVANLIIELTEKR